MAGEAQNNEADLFQQVPRILLIATQFVRTYIMGVNCCHVFLKRYYDNVDYTRGVSIYAMNNGI